MSSIFSCKTNKIIDNECSYYIILFYIISIMKVGGRNPEAAAATAVCQTMVRGAL